VAVGDSNVSGKAARLMHSLDGKTWTAEDISALGLTGELFEVCHGNGLFVAVGTGGGIITRPADYSSAWTKQTSGTSAGLGGVAYGNGLYVAVGDGGVILTSPDALAWTPRTSNVGGYLDSVIWAGGQFVASGQNRNVCTSPDGITWTAQTTGLGSGSDWLVTLTHNGSLYALGGTGGLLFTSPDAVTWTARTSGTTGTIGALAWSGERFIGVGDDGMAFRSDDGTTWTLFASGTSADLCGLAVVGDEAVAVGEGVTLYSQGTSGPVRPVPFDFEGNGHNDVFWRNSADGTSSVWLMNGTSKISTCSLPERADLNEQVVGMGDFDQDGTPDIFWRNSSTGRMSIWYLNSDGSQKGAANLWCHTDPNLVLEGIGDVNNDQKPDVILHHIAGDRSAAWLMNNTAVIGFANLGRASSDYRFVGAEDFDQDGMNDILIHNKVTGHIGVLIMNKTAEDKYYAASYTRIRNFPVAWVPEFTADLNRDGAPDIFWRNQALGGNWIWLLDHFTVSQETGPGAMPAVWQAAN